jgi:hypothetical protein
MLEEGIVQAQMFGELAWIKLIGFTTDKFKFYLSECE